MDSSEGVDVLIRLSRGVDVYQHCDSISANGP